MVSVRRARVDDGLVWSWLSTADLAACGLALDETESLIDVIRTVRESCFALMLKEMPDGGWKGSLRSRGEVDVAAIARSLGGGGHRRAAGFAFAGTPEEAAGAVLGLATSQGCGEAYPADATPPSLEAPSGVPEATAAP